MDNYLMILEDYLSQKHILFYKNYEIKYRCYSKTGGKVQCFVMPDSVDKLKELCSKLIKEKVQYKIIGSTANILFLDDVEYGVIISTSLINNIEFSQNKVKVEAGKQLTDFVQILVSKNIEGYEGLEGIPGYIGGAVVMNAGAYGYCISDNLLEVSCIDKMTGNTVILSKEQCQFNTRDSIFRETDNYIILSATFSIKEGNQVEIHNNVETYHIARHVYQEFVYPNLGSVFTTKKDIYEELGSNKKLYQLHYKIYRKLFYNRITRFINRKRPNRSKLNDLAMKYFSFDFNNIYSIKNLNTFTNINSTSYNILDYMYQLKKCLGDRGRIENEILIEGIVENKIKDFSKIKEKINFINGD